MGLAVIEHPSPRSGRTFSLEAKKVQTIVSGSCHLVRSWAITRQGRRLLLAPSCPASLGSLLARDPGREPYLLTPQGTLTAVQTVSGEKPAPHPAAPPPSRPPEGSLIHASGAVGTACLVLIVCRGCPRSGQTQPHSSSMQVVRLEVAGRARRRGRDAGSGCRMDEPALRWGPWAGPGQTGSRRALAQVYQGPSRTAGLDRKQGDATGGGRCPVPGTSEPMALPLCGTQMARSIKMAPGVWPGQRTG